MLIVTAYGVLLAALHRRELVTWLTYRHSLVRMRYELSEILDEAQQEC